MKLAMRQIENGLDCGDWGAQARSDAAKILNTLHDVHRDIESLVFRAANTAAGDPL